MEDEKHAKDAQIKEMQEYVYQALVITKSLLWGSQCVQFNHKCKCTSVNMVLQENKGECEQIKSNEEKPANREEEFGTNVGGGKAERKPDDRRYDEDTGTYSITLKYIMRLPIYIFKVNLFL